MIRASLFVRDLTQFPVDSCCVYGSWLRRNIIMYFWMAGYLYVSWRTWLVLSGFEH